MKKLTKILAIALIVSIVGSFAACGGTVNDSTTKAPVESGASSSATGIKTADDIWGKKIGVQLGTTGDIYASDYADKDKAAEAGNKELSVVERYTKGADAVLALSTGKIDCVIIDNEPAKAFVAANKGLKILDEEFAVEEYAIALKKGSDLTAKINSALAELKADGTIDSIIKNYIGDDTKGKTPYTSPADVKRTNGTLTMATNAAFEPYEFLKDQKIVGIDVDIAQAIADKLGMELKIEDMKFDAIITAVQQDKADIGVAGMTITEDRLKQVDFSTPYTTATQVIIVKE